MVNSHTKYYFNTFRSLDTNSSPHIVTTCLKMELMTTKLFCNKGVSDDPEDINTFFCKNHLTVVVTASYSENSLTAWIRRLFMFFIILDACYISSGSGTMGDCGTAMVTQVSFESCKLYCSNMNSCLAITYNFVNSGCRRESCSLAIPSSNVGYEHFLKSTCPGNVYVFITLNILCGI